MAASDCSFCGNHGVPCVLRKGTAAICGPCANSFVARTPEQLSMRARFERELELAHERALDGDSGDAQRRRAFARAVARLRRPQPPSDVSAEGDCSFCGQHEIYPFVGFERLWGETEDVTVSGQPVRICSSCVDRAVAAGRPS